MGLAAGTRLGAYEVLGTLGAGGMGEVYRARDSRLERDVAIKILPAGFTADPERLRRFDREARAASALSHPNLLTIFDIGTHAGSPYIVSELLEGQTLRVRLATGALPARRAVEFARQITEGLAAAHSKGIVHRDLKPENLFVTRDALHSKGARVDPGEGGPESGPSARDFLRDLVTRRRIPASGNDGCRSVIGSPTRMGPGPVRR